jgi:hypothetical protein
MDLGNEKGASIYGPVRNGLPFRIRTLGPNSQRHSISDRTVNTGALLIAQIHDYILGLKSTKTLIVGLQKI